MYWDIPGITEAYASELSRYLDCSVHDSPGSSGSTSSSSDTPSGSIDSSLPADISGSQRRDLTRYIPPPGLVTTGDIRGQQYSSSSRHNDLRFLELCINSEHYRKVVIEINVKKALNDGRFFKLISDAYWKQRRQGYWAFFKNQKWCFRKPSKLSFRRV